MGKTRVSFLFGAGAEKCFGLPLGDDYCNKTLFPEEIKKITLKNALSELFEKHEDKDNYPYTSDTIVGLNECVRETKEYKQGLLDAYFHTIINPQKYGKRKFSAIVNYYWSCYFAIVEPLLKFLADNNLLSAEFNDYYQNGIVNYKNIVTDIDRFTKLLYKVDLSKIKKENYYSCIKQKLSKLSDFVCSGIITTNYYRFAEIINPDFLKKGKIAYPNGQLKYFECPSLIEVQDFSDKKIDAKDFSNRIFFPFIFGQSFVKPIIHSVQVTEFHKMNTILNNSDILIILGYGIMEDDNHVNAYLHQFVKDNHKIIYVTNENETSDNNLWKKLHLSQDKAYSLIWLKVNYKDGCSKIVERIFEKLHSISVEHNKKGCA